MRLGLEQLAPLRRDGLSPGLASICSAHPLVIRAALQYGRETSSTVLIEATCNQVNHQGGYTGMHPADFVDLVTVIAQEEDYPLENVIFGGDHLGPNPWRHLSADDAMKEAEAMVTAYVKAGFEKIHLDASMSCAGEPQALSDEVIAERAVRLAQVAEKAAVEAGLKAPYYIIGTEVPPPGGADHELTSIAPTNPEAALNTIRIHRERFAEAGILPAFNRVVGLVVQPGVEFGNHNVILYDRDKAKSLIGILQQEPHFVFEAHSTDYQGRQILADLVEDGFAILKVGPELTFVLREAFYALDLIASDLVPGYGQRPLYSTFERVMLENSDNWARHYDGDDSQKTVLRHYSLSDRIRYYWNTPQVKAACDHLLEVLSGRTVLLPLIRQHLPGAEQFANRPLDPTAVLLWRIKQTIDNYHMVEKTSQLVQEDIEDE